MYIYPISKLLILKGKHHVRCKMVGSNGARGPICSGRACLIVVLVGEYVVPSLRTLKNGATLL
jgi:hypothetical protein